jgi:hypothetical protein
MDRAAARPHLLAVVEVLDANATEDRMQVVRHIAGGVHLRRARPTAFVDENTVGLRDGLPGEGR